MAHKGYEKGVQFEHQVKKRLEQDGYRCIRSAGSHGIIDLICGRRGVSEIMSGSRLVIQCRIRGNLTTEEEKELKECARDFDARPILAYKQDKELWFRNL